MKICLINNLYPPYARGGAEQVVHRTVEGLREKGYEVVLVTSMSGEKEIEEKQNLKIYRMYPRNIFFYTDAHRHNFFMRFIWHVIDMFNSSVCKEVKHILKQEQPDIVHTHNLMGLSFLIPRVVRKLQIKHVHTVHDVQLVEPSGIILKTKENSWRYTGFPTKFYTWVMKQLMGSPEVVISPSQFLLDFYRSRGLFQGTQTILLRNPLTLNFVRRKSAVKRRKDYGELFNFLYLGQIEEHKGVFLLAEAFEKVKNAKLHIVGDGSKLDELKNIVTENNLENIEFYGRVDRDKLPELFSHIDMTIVPSLCYENSPTVIFESLYFDVPVLASRIEGIAELIEEGKNGFTFETGDLESLQEKMEWCIEHVVDIKKMELKTPTLMRSEGEYVTSLISLYTGHTDDTL
ncbi:MAG: glycosyltransferase family 4 protein [Candidatus Magasanikbacteria bacterium]|nr:glycosyltransferase family 4 protein [Candidatus Magasanikbacteria bacterium]